MDRIENIKDLVTCLDPSDLLELRKDLKIREGESLTIDQIKQIILDTCFHNINNLQVTYEWYISSYYSIYEIEYTEQFQDEVYFRNQEWMDILFFLFQLYEYDYYLDCLNELLFVEPPMYTDFFSKLGMLNSPDYGKPIDSEFYFSNKKVIVNIFEKEKRSDKLKNLISNITGACIKKQSQLQ